MSAESAKFLKEVNVFAPPSLEISPPSDINSPQSKISSPSGFTGKDRTAEGFDRKEFSPVAGQLDNQPVSPMVTSPNTSSREFYSSAQRNPNKSNSSTDSKDISKDELHQELVSVTIYDKQSSSTILRINRRNIARDICRTIAAKMDLSKDESKFYSLVLVVTVFEPIRRSNVHCVRSYNLQESVLGILDLIIEKLAKRYQSPDTTKLRKSVRWFFKDTRTSPLDLGDVGDIIGDEASDDEEDISHSDLAYLAKVDRKGYLLKRSSRDFNLWKRWYCVLTDHLWCIDINQDSPKAIRIHLSSLVRYQSQFVDQLQNIIINSPKGTSQHFRAFSIADHKKWLEDLTAKTVTAKDNDIFSVAEMIIQDEEGSRYRRFQRSLDKLLETTQLEDSLLIDHSKLTNSQPSTSSSISRSNSGSSDKVASPPSSLGNSQKSAPVSLNPPQQSRTTTSFPSVDDIEERFMLHPMDRTITTSVMHRLHTHDRTLFRIISFILDVVRYKELFRHDLFISPSAQRSAALSIYENYLLPQINGESSSAVAGARTRTQSRVRAGSNASSLPHSPPRGVATTSVSGSVRPGYLLSRLRIWRQQQVQQQQDVLPKGRALSNLDEVIDLDPSTEQLWGLSAEPLVGVQRALFSLDGWSSRASSASSTRESHMQSINIAGNVNSLPSAKQMITDGVIESYTPASTSSSGTRSIALPPPPPLQSSKSHSNLTSLFWPWSTSSSSSSVAASSSSSNVLATSQTQIVSSESKNNGANENLKTEPSYLPMVPEVFDNIVAEIISILDSKPVGEGAS